MNLKLMNLKLIVFLYFLALFGTFWCLVFCLRFFVLVKSYRKKIKNKNKKFKTDLITSFVLLPSKASVNAQYGAKHTFLQIIFVKLSNGHTFIETNNLLDCGSDTTLLREDVAQRLNLKEKK